MVKSFQLLKNDTIGIFGSGFGFYGYLKAFQKINTFEIFFQKNSLLKISNNKSLKKINALNFDEIVKKSKYIVIARRPFDQYKLIYKILKIKNDIIFYLEKPLCQNPKKSLEVLNYLHKKNIVFKVNYIFLHTDWFKIISKIIKKKNNEITINWKFNNNNLNSWKFKKIYGGGIIRYYGIQFIAIASIMGFDKCLKSNLKENIKKKFFWNIIFKDKNKNKLSINFFLNYGEDSFIISNNKNEIIKNDNPFTKEKNNYKDDNRIEYLIKYLNNKNNLKFIDHLKIIKLWQDIERVNLNV